MHDLFPIRADPVEDLIPAVRAALDGSGPALLPLAPDSPSLDDLPKTVPVSIALVVSTSGSSGVPKRVGLSAGALLASAAATEGALGGPGAWLLALPATGIAGLQVIIRAITAGADPVVLRPGRFDPAVFAAGVREMPADRRRYSSLVPAQLFRVLSAIEAGDADVARAARSLDAVLIGGGRTEDALAGRAHDHGLRIVRTYGMTETSGGCVYDGVPLAGVRVRIVDGEIQIAGPTLADSYLGMPELTESVFLPETGLRWYRTGDLGTWDGERLQVRGRVDDVIKSGGVKVSLAQVQSVVREMPGLEEAVVVRAAHPEWGDVPVVATSADVALAELRSYVVDRLGRAAAPRALHRFAELPMLANGKPDLRTITAAFDGTAWDVP